MPQPHSCDEDVECIKTTIGKCPLCLQLCEARVLQGDGKIFISRMCPEHGETTNLISSDARFYWLAKGNQACCSLSNNIVGSIGRNAKAAPDSTFETLSTCLALIEIVNSCNLSCPTCYADSPRGKGGHVDAVPLSNIQDRIDQVIARKGKIEILQLSGGEPLLHPNLIEIVRWVRDHPKIDYLLINTNGVRLARDREFAASLAAEVSRGNIQLYLQFDGVQEDGQAFLRGADLREVRAEAIVRCEEIGLPITLAMTVIPQNLESLWSSLSYGLQFPHVRGISFQPMFYSGRFPGGDVPRLNTADIILNLVEQSAGKLKFDDFTPLPCGDPNCAIIGYLLKIGGTIRSVSDFVNFRAVQGFLKDKVYYDLQDLAQCGCESEPLGAILKRFELKESNAFRIFIKPFMDAWSWDQDRIDRCCTHVIRPDGKLDSFCRYYTGGH
ncbi:MAG: radical SAM protein [Bdellovibrionales bacterium]|nr:radical SAM protein [Bdellovibrionales bacterium]